MRRTTYITCPEHIDCVAGIAIDDSGVDLPAPYWVTEWLKKYPEQVLVELTHTEATTKPESVGEFVSFDDVRGQLKMVRDILALVDTSLDMDREALVAASNHVRTLDDRVAKLAVHVGRLTAKQDRDQAIQQTQLQFLEEYLTRKPRLKKAWDKYMIARLEEVE